MYTTSTEPSKEPAITLEAMLKTIEDFNAKYPKSGRLVKVHLTNKAIGLLQLYSSPTPTPTFPGIPLQTDDTLKPWFIAKLEYADGHKEDCNLLPDQWKPYFQNLDPLDG